MSLYKLTGVDEDLETIGRRSKTERKAARVIKKTTRKAKKAIKKETHKAKVVRRKAERKANGGGLRFVKKIGAAPARGAFLGLVRLNALKLATKLAGAIKKDPSKVQKFWLRVGGKYEELKKTVSKASGQTLSGYEEAQVASVTLAAAIATATPVLAMAFALFKELGLSSPKDEVEEQSILKQGAEDLGNDPSLQGGYADMPSDSPSAVMPKNPDASLEESFESSSETGGGKKSIPSDMQSQEFTDTTESKATEPTTDEPKDNTMLLVGVAALALLLLSKRG